MTNFAIVENGVVVNVIVADADFAAEIGAIPCSNAGVGWSHVGGVFSAPPAPPPHVPQAVTRGQFILALLQLNLLDAVETAVAAASRTIQVNYAERVEFNRSHPLIQEMAFALGKTDAEVDALFVLAATL